MIKHSEEFKQEAVRIALTSGAPCMGCGHRPNPFRTNETWPERLQRPTGAMSRALCESLVRQAGSPGSNTAHDQRVAGRQQKRQDIENKREKWWR